MGFTKRLVESVMQTARSSTSGYQSDDDINRNLEMVDNEIMETLAPLYSINGKVQDLLQNFIKSVNTDIIDGALIKPESYLQYIDSSFNGKPIYPRNNNEISLIKNSPIRMPKIDKGPYYVYFSEGKIQYLPSSINKVDLMYIRKPIAGSIVFDIVSTDQSDYTTTRVLKEIEWPDRAFNLFYYSMLEKYGFEQNSQLTAEYSQLGISREITKV